MGSTMKEFKSLISTVVIAVSLTASTCYADIVNFPGATSRSPNFPSIDNVTGDLQLPKGVNLPVPAVLILHSSAGYKSGRGELYSRALLEKGIATLEIKMFSRGNRPEQGTIATMTHVYGALDYLASHSQIQPNKIGVMGMSWGGALAMRTASASIGQAFQRTTPVYFAAHAPMYPGCFGLRQVQKRYKNYDYMTGAPVLLLWAGNDSYDSPDSCEKFFNELPTRSKSVITMHGYPNATHAWDIQTRTGTDYHFDKYANELKGGKVKITADRKVTNDAKDRIVKFFQDNLQR